MREVPIFIASSMKLDQEREELSRFLDELNDVYKDTGVRLVWDGPENMSQGITRGGSQLPYDKKILESRFFILLVAQELGKYTRAEFELALNQYVLTKAPVILPYFYQKGGVPLSGEALAFRDRLREKLNYYTQSFTDFTLLKRTLQIDLEKSGAFEPETPEPGSVEDLLEQVQGKVRRENEEQQRKVPIFIASSMKLEQERAELSGFLKELNDVHSDSGVQLVWDGPENMSHSIMRGGSQLPYDRKLLDSRFFILLVTQELGQYTRIEYERALNQHDLTKEPVILPYFYEKGGVPLSEEVLDFRNQLRERLHCRTNTYTDFAQLKRAIQIDLEQSGAFEAEMPEPDSIEKLRKQIRVKAHWEVEGQQREIEWMKKRKPSERLFMEITKAYENMTRLVEKFLVSPNVLLDYILFLWQQRLYDRAIELGHWLESMFRNDDPGEKAWGILYNCLGLCYADNNLHRQAENYCRKTLEISRRMAQTNPAVNKLYVADACNNLAALLYHMNRMEDAETCYREALEILRRLAQDNPAVHAPHLAMTCDNLGGLLAETNRMKEAETLHREALEIYRRLAKTDPAAYEPHMATTCDNLGSLLKKTNRMEEAETFYRETLEIRRRLARTNPAAYEPDVATTCNNLASLLEDTNRTEESETFYRKALDCYSRLAETNPAAYAPYVATICNNLANLLHKTNRLEEAETFYGEALKIRRRLAQDSFAVYAPNVADTCTSLGIMLIKMNRMEDAETLCREALEIRCRLAQDNPVAYVPGVAKALYNLGTIETVRSHGNLESEKFSA